MKTAHAPLPTPPLSPLLPPSSVVLPLSLSRAPTKLCLPLDILLCVADHSSPATLSLLSPRLSRLKSYYIIATTLSCNEIRALAGTCKSLYVVLAPLLREHRGLREEIVVRRNAMIGKRGCSGALYYYKAGREKRAELRAWMEQRRAGIRVSML